MRQATDIDHVTMSGWSIVRRPDCFRRWSGCKCLLHDAK